MTKLRKDRKANLSSQSERGRTKDIPKVAGHSQENANITFSPAGHKSLVLTAKVMVAVGLRLLLDEELRKNAKTEHAEWLKKYEK